MQRIVTVVGHRRAHRKWIAQIGRSALAVVTARCIDADGIRSAWILETFVNVTATNERIAGEADGTDALDASIDLSTLGTRTALRLSARIFRLNTTNFVRIPNRSRITNALVRYDAVTTMSIFTTSGLTRWIVDCCVRSGEILKISFFLRKFKSDDFRRGETYVACKGSRDFQRNMVRKYICLLLVRR